MGELACASGGDSQGLANCLMRLASDFALLNGLRQAGQQEAQLRFSVMESTLNLEHGFRQDASKKEKGEIKFF